MSDAGETGGLGAAGLRKAFAHALLGRYQERVCPAPEAVWDALHGTDAELRGQMVDHMAGCPVCAEAWRLAVRGTPVAGAGDRR